LDDERKWNIECTFVLPLVEKADVLRCEVITVEMPRTKAQAAEGRAVETDCIAQVKIAGDDASLTAAAQYFLNQNPAQIKETVRPLLEKHLRSIVAGSSDEQAVQNPVACAAKVQSAASADLSKMGLSVMSFTIRNSRPA
jgi:flotillin